MESVKQGSACIALRSSSHSVIGALKRAVSELSSHQQKILEIDDHIGIGIAGLTADARTLAKWMRNECLNHKYVYGTAMPTGRLATDLADRHQRTTQTYVRRPCALPQARPRIPGRQLGYPLLAEGRGFQSGTTEAAPSCEGNVQLC